MISIKLLEIKDKQIENTFNKSYPKFVEALNKVLGYNVEIITEQDNSYGGYYITHIGLNSINEFNNSIINEKSFLLEVDDSFIPKYLEQFQPSGLISLRFFRRASTAIVGKMEVIESVKTLEDRGNIIYEELGYDDYVPIPYDDTYETVAKAILSYLELYDKWLKNR